MPPPTNKLYYCILQYIFQDITKKIHKSIQNKSVIMISRYSIWILEWLSTRKSLGIQTTAPYNLPLLTFQRAYPLIKPILDWYIHVLPTSDSKPWTVCNKENVASFNMIINRKIFSAVFWCQQPCEFGSPGLYSNIISKALANKLV